LSLSYTSATDDVLIQLAKTKSLQNVSHLDFQPVSDAALSQLGLMPQLKNLNIANEITDAGMKSLNQFPNLEALVIARTVGAQGFREIARLPRLKSLQISDWQLTPEIIDVLKTIPLLENVSISNASVEEFDSSRTQLLLSIPQLRTLGVSNLVRPDVAGIKLLAKATHITKLLLGRATDHDLELLAGNTALQFLELPNSKASPEAIAKFRAARPTVELTVDGKTYPAEKQMP
jgi:Leucine-rich repeat (LRR) protein